MKPVLRHVLWTLLWGSVVGYVILAIALRDDLRAHKKVARLEIELRDSSEMGFLVTADRVRRQIERAKIPTVGEQVDKVDCDRIERLITHDGFVEKAVAYITNEGVLRIKISQRDPVYRLMSDRRNSYVTRTGYTFVAPPLSSVYVPVVTGDYAPPFPRDYKGSVRDYIERRIDDLDLEISQLEKSKRPLYQWMDNYTDSMRKERRRFIKRQWWLGENEEEFDKRVVKLRREKKMNRRRFRYIRGLYQDTVKQIARQQESRKMMQKKLQKNYEDFVKLLTFVEHVEEDAFWRSEVVQIVARSTPAGSLEVDLIPRSGDFRILFGRLDEVDRKFARLERFYRKGLSRIGWNHFRSIDVRYDNQVICKR